MHSVDFSQQRKEIADRLIVSFPEQLPISEKISEIQSLWLNNQVIIVEGETGSGKTTQLPKIALKLGCGINKRIGCTQPRRIAATAMASRLREELHANDSLAVGCKIRFDDRTAPETMIKFMTDGVLLAETAGDHLLQQYDALIIDETHERSLNIDFILGYLLRILPQRPDLRVAISSATIETEKFSSFFHNAPVIKVSGRTFPIQDVYLPPMLEEDLSDLVARGIEKLDEIKPNSDVLVFLPGEREIKECCDLLTGRKLRNTEVLPLYARLSKTEQQKVFKPGRLRRIILSTNVAETSLTIPRITGVVDSGLARIKRFAPNSGIEELNIECISQASAKQRRGRCGRIANGVAVHLYSEDDLLNSPAATDPEIKRSGLAGVILRMLELRLPRIEYFPFMDPPSNAGIRDGWRTLRDLEAVDAVGDLTVIGKKIAKIPLDPALGKMLLKSDELGVWEQIAVVVGFLSVLDPFEYPSEHRQQATEAHRLWLSENSDFSSIVRLWNDLVVSSAFESQSKLRKFCKAKFLNYNRVREWKNIVEELAKIFKKSFDYQRLADDANGDKLHTAILSGVPRLLSHFDANKQSYVTATGRQFELYRNSALVQKRRKPEWIIAFALMDTGRVFARQSAEVSPELFEKAAPHLCKKIVGQAFFEAKSGFVRATERVIFGNFIISPGKRIDFAKVDPAAAREIFIRDGLCSGILNLKCGWLEKYYNRISELEKFEIKCRRPDSIINREKTVEYFMSFLPGNINSVNSLKKSILGNDKKNKYFPPPDEALIYDDVDLSWEKKFPDYLHVYNQKYSLIYQFEPGEDYDGVTIYVPENCLNTLSARICDWPVDGYLEDLICLMMRKIPKDIRRTIKVSDVSADFVTQVENKEISKEQTVASALCNYLLAKQKVKISIDLFDDLERPEYLKLKIAVLNKDGKIKEVLRELPEQLRMNTHVNYHLSGAFDMERKGFADWPQDLSLPFVFSVKKTENNFFPAVFADGDKISSGFFLDENEAKNQHVSGLLALIKNELIEQHRYFKRHFKISDNMKLDWFCNDNEDDYREELINQAWKQANNEDWWSVRNYAKFGEFIEIARNNVGTAAYNVEQILSNIYKLYIDSTKLFFTIRNKQYEHCNILQAHLDFLFSKHFLTRDYFWDGNIRRYLRAFKLRVERFSNNPGRDWQKYEPLEVYWQRLITAVKNTENFVTIPSLYYFFLVFEECNIAVFAPELGVKIKSPLNKLQEAWENVRY